MLINKFVLNYLRLCRRELQLASRLQKGKWKHIDTKVSIHSIVHMSKMERINS